MHNLTVLILAAGRGERWAQASNKVLVYVRGEPLIIRTQRLAKSIFGVDPIVVATEKDVVAAVYPVKLCYPEASRWTVETLFSTHRLWRGRTIVLLGDTYYTEKTLRLIKHTDLPVCYFGRLLEIYAMSFNDPVAVLRLLRDAIKHAEQNSFPENRPGRLWHTWYRLHGHPMDTHTIPPAGDGSFIRLLDNDITMDIDTPKDYGELLDKIR